MLKALYIFFVILGVVFFILIIAGTYFFITDPYNLKPMFLGAESTEVVGSDEATTTSDGTEVMEDKHLLLSDGQEKALETVGIDPTKLPSKITPEQEVCFEGILGAERVAEIKAGATPSMSEFFKAKECLN